MTLSFGWNTCQDCQPCQFPSSSVKARVFRCPSTCCSCSIRERYDESCILILARITRHRCVVLDVSIEQVAALSSQSTLLEPTLDLTRLQPSMSTIPTTRKPNASPLRATLPSYSSEDPWNSNARFTGLSSNVTDTLPNGTPSTVAGSGMPKDWWKKQENIRVTILGQQGFILNRYMVYEISSEVSCQCKSLEPQAPFY